MLGCFVNMIKCLTMTWRCLTRAKIVLTSNRSLLVYESLAFLCFTMSTQRPKCGVTISIPFSMMFIENVLASP